jgi:hypothetical protein
MSTSIFEQVTSSLTVVSICGPLGPDIPAGTPFLDVESFLDPDQDSTFDPWNDPSRVIDSNGNLVGILWFADWAQWAEQAEQADLDIPTIADDDDLPEIVDDVVDLPEPRQFLSSSTTILEAVQLFAEVTSRLFYVIDANQVVGYLRYQHLFHPVGRLAFLALALEIEDLALTLCQHPPFREDAWQSISDSRKRKAIERYRDRYGCEPKLPMHIDRLIDCTQLADRAIMIWKTQLISSSRLELLGFFHHLGEIRNYCAHPQRLRTFGDPIPKQKLSKFINDAESMRNSLNEALFEHGVTKWHLTVL